MIRRCGTGRRAGSDGLAAGAAIVLFSFALGASNLALPLVALSAGFSPAEVGVLTAVSAVAQLLVRATIPAISRRLADRSLVSASATLIAASCAVVALSTAVVPFVLAELLQGAARGYFWSGSQLHAVRTSASPLKAIARMNLLSSAGLLAGPVMAGALADSSPSSGLVVASGMAAIGTGAALFMDRLPVLEPAVDRSESGQLWRRPPVVRGSAASWGGGAWSALVVSYVPVILAGEQPAVVVGVLVAVANGANILGSAAVGAIPPGRSDTWLVAGTVANGVGLALVAPAAESAWTAAAALLVCGLGSGALLTLGPVLAIEAVSDDERAGAIAVTGGARAAALLVTPLLVAGAVSVMPLAAAMAVMGAVLAVPMRIRGRD